MLIDSTFGRIELINETAYTFCSTDNVHRYLFAKNLAEEFRPTSIHGVLLNGEPLAVFGDSGGGSGIHEHSAILIHGLLYLAVGSHVVCFRPTPFEYRWALQTDTATCFGVYFDETHNALISHGELEISRFTEEGQLVWSKSGADIFTEAFSLQPQFIEVLDFNKQTYHFNYGTGDESV
jgi:hypothetical protein